LIAFLLFKQFFKMADESSELELLQEVGPVDDEKQFDDGPQQTRRTRPRAE
jgi:hypothetical protein